MFLAYLLLPVVIATCPFQPQQETTQYESQEHYLDYHKKEDFLHALRKLDFRAVETDIAHLLTSSKPFWPADFGNYGPLMIRHAWHCAGSYRASDGRGGCDGARQRFEPELSWPDNTNLDKAKSLLWPIKEKYGLGLSWGDLIILAGNVAIRSMGGPILGFCAGRVDDATGEASELLGPTAVQNKRYPCLNNGHCNPPFGASTIGLIYVNPEGPMGAPDPAGSALEMRAIFARMNLNDSQTVALIGGGHAFGKAHGACPLGAGPSPEESPFNPWPGLCGSGRGSDTFTSGFEGQWTDKPTRWSNDFFANLLRSNWEVFVGPGGRYQWRAVSGNVTTHSAGFMLTTDIALLHDPTGVYQKYVSLYASDRSALDRAFAQAWYELTTRDMGPATRCAGPDVPPAQDFQHPLPPPLPPHKLADFDRVAKAIERVMSQNSSHILQPDIISGKPSYAGVFVKLAWQCASTFRQTDFQGGCNGARIRFLPQVNWHTNVGITQALQLLQPVKNQFGVSVSWADLIVLAGKTALKSMMGTSHSRVAFSFCPGRTDSSDGTGWANISPNGNYSSTAEELKESMHLLGLSIPEFVALAARPRSPQIMMQNGFEPVTWVSSTPSFPSSMALSNEYFKVLLDHEWLTHIVRSSGKAQYKSSVSCPSSGLPFYVLPVDLAIKYDPEFRAAAQIFASDNSLFLSVFAAAWTKVMNSDQFDGPIDNLCGSGHTPPLHDINYSDTEKGAASVPTPVKSSIGDFEGAPPKIKEEYIRAHSPWLTFWVLIVILAIMGLLCCSSWIVRCIHRMYTRSGYERIVP